MINKELPSGIFSWFGYDLPLSARAKLIKEAGFGSTFLWYGNEEKLFTSGDINLAPQIVRDNGLIVETVHASYLNCGEIWYKDSKIKQQKISEYLEVISYASRHQIPCVVIHVTSSSLDTIPNEVGLQSLEQIITFAEEENIYIAIENTRKTNFLDYVFNNIKSSNLKLCYDSSHDFLYGNPPLSIFEKWGHLLLATHLSDNDGESDKHWLPFTGVANWDSIAKNLLYNNNLQSIMIEAFPQNPDSLGPAEFLSQAYEASLRIKKLA